jgi:hypothetical protein
MELSQPSSPWKIGLVLQTPALSSGIQSALAEIGVAPVLECRSTAPSFEVAIAVERERPDILFVELARTVKTAARTHPSWSPFTIRRIRRK